MEFLQLQPPNIDWSNPGNPKSIDFDDIYFNTDSGIAETQYVFIDGNELKSRFAAATQFTIAELGFGSGLNFAVTLSHWLKHRQKHSTLDFVSFELSPWTAEQLERIAIVDTHIQIIHKAIRKQLPSAMPGIYTMLFPEFHARLLLVQGDVTTWLPRMTLKANAWFLDGFNPAKNAVMWQANLFSELARHTANEGTIATYSAASHVRKALQETGFSVQKRAGFGRKREMLTGKYTIKTSKTFSPSKKQRIAVFGAGVAGMSVAARFASAGHDVTIYDKHSYIGQEASGNPAAIIYPYICKGSQPTNRFAWAAYEYLLSYFSTTLELQSTECITIAGVDQEFSNDKLPALLQQYDNKRITLSDTIAGISFKTGSYIKPSLLFQHIMEKFHHHITFCASAKISHFNPALREFKVNNQLYQSDIIVDTRGQQSSLLDVFPQHNLVYGSVATLRANSQSEKITSIHCGNGYFTPAITNHTHIAGATFSTTQQSAAEATKQIADANASTFRQYALSADDTLTTRESTRVTTHDRMPICGKLFDVQKVLDHKDDIYHGRVKLEKLREYNYEQIYTMTGLGSRGFVSAWILAETIFADSQGVAAPLDHQLVAAIDPMRGLIKSKKASD